jgi:hypothetical protein
MNSSRSCSTLILLVAVIACASEPSPRSATASDTSTVLTSVPSAGGTAAHPSVLKPLDSTDFVLAGLTEGGDSTSVLARLGRPDSVTVDKNPYDTGGHLPTWHYRGLDVDFIEAAIQGFEITGPQIRTARAIGVGDTEERLITAYGEPNSRLDDLWSYDDPRHDLHTIAFTIRTGRIVKIFIGTVLD